MNPEVTRFHPDGVVNVPLEVLPIRPPTRQKSPGCHPDGRATDWVEALVPSVLAAPRRVAKRPHLLPDNCRSRYFRQTYWDHLNPVNVSRGNSSSHGTFPTYSSARRDDSGMYRAEPDVRTVACYATRPMVKRRGRSATGCAEASYRTTRINARQPEVWYSQA